MKKELNEIIYLNFEMDLNIQMKKGSINSKKKKADPDKIIKKSMPIWKQNAWKEILAQLGLHIFHTKKEFLDGCKFAYDSGFSEPVKNINYAERRKWIPFFKELQISPAKVFSMDKDTFEDQKKLK